MFIHKLFFIEIGMLLWVKQASSELCLIERSLEPKFFDFVRKVLSLVLILLLLTITLLAHNLNLR